MSIEASRDVRLSKSLICTLPELKVWLFSLFIFLLLVSKLTERENSQYVYVRYATGIDFDERRVYSALPQCRFLGAALSDKSVARPFTHTVKYRFCCLLHVITRVLFALLRCVFRRIHSVIVSSKCFRATARATFRLRIFSTFFPYLAKKRPASSNFIMPSKSMVITDFVRYSP